MRRAWILWTFWIAAGALAALGQAPENPSAISPRAPADGPAQSSTPPYTQAPPSTQMVREIAVPEIPVREILVPEILIREIYDRPTGHLWLLERDGSRPEGPGRLVLAGGRHDPSGAAGSAFGRNAAAGRPAQQISPTAPIPVIRAGDRVVVEENTAAVEARLEATALSPAAAGSPFKARLELGGKIVRAVALSAGRAELAPEPAPDLAPKLGGQP